MKTFRSVVMMLAVLGLIWGCNKPRPPFNFSGETLPVFVEDRLIKANKEAGKNVPDTTSITQTLVNGRMEETVTLPNSGVTSVDKYLKFFQETGWTLQENQADVDAMKVSLQKGEKTMQILYRSDLGVTLNSSKPQPK